MNEFEYNLREQAARRIEKAAAYDKPTDIIRSYEVTSSWEPLQIEGQFNDGYYFYYRYRSMSIYMEVNLLPCSETTGSPIYSERRGADYEAGNLTESMALKEIESFWVRFNQTQNNEE